MWVSRSLPARTKNGEMSMPDYEALLERFYLSILSPGNTAIDVGAHTGRHTLPMLRAVAPDGKVHAFEPLPDARRQLEQDVLADPVRTRLATISSCALSDHEGTEEFVCAVDLPGYSGLRTRIYDYPTRIERIPVRVSTLDHTFRDASAIDYIKIDAEGGELAILRGATSVIDRFSPVVTFEFGANTLANYGVTVEDMAEFWQNKPYRLFDIVGRPLSREAFVESSKRQEVWDYIALPKERTEEIIAGWKTRSAG